ncbi:tRNA pseudouridine(13) synthase TruD [Celerinatantimonas yamalensis]|uniref:tRNA pseudouridine synthase D n=1 Tax=Celerinatantimonas yamalensis TaxID=559956 RepID=A0ABW9G8D2_9GAMM
MYNELAWLHGQPTVNCLFKQQLDDFQVTEILPFSADGHGEHVLVEIEKSGENTQWAAAQLARCLNVSVKQVSYAGLKDRQGITRQWFSVQLPFSKSLNWQKLPASLRVLQAHRHSKKLRRGALSGNQFNICLRQISDKDEAQRRLALIRQFGVPNYFGAQRFGHEGNNLLKAQQMFAGKRIQDREKRGLYLSAARSLLFNQTVSGRIDAGLDKQLIVGDCLMLAGSRSFFVAETITEELNERLANGDIQLSGPLVGDAQLPSQAAALAFESEQLSAYQSWWQGLAKAGLRQERRPLLVRPEQFSWQWLDDCTLQLSFILPSGCYATSVIRELANIQSI